MSKESTETIAEHHRKNNHDPVDKILWKLSLTTKALIVIATIIAIGTQDFFLITSGILALIFMFLPAILKRTWDVYLPIEVDAFVALFIFIHLAFGELSDYYSTLWFDFILHWTSGLVFALLGFLAIYTFLAINKVHARPAAVLLLTIAFAMGMGATWEIFEFSMDQIFGFSMQKNSLTDTMWDLMAALIGAIIISLLGYRYITLPERRRGIIHRLVQKIHASHRHKEKQQR